jgi:acylphosphatase
MAWVAKHLKITGKVQGVGFRYFTRKNADSLDITGWVRNMPDGSVEVFICGDEDNIDRMEERLWDGPRGAYVTEIIQLESDDTGTHYLDFSVLR